MLWDQFKYILAHLFVARLQFLIEVYLLLVAFIAKLIYQNIQDTLECV